MPIQMQNRVFILLLVAIAMLVVYGYFVDPRTLQLYGLNNTLNDQIVYIDAARHLLADGHLTTGIIYPSTLQQEYTSNYLYQPGHALLLAGTFALLGDGPIQAMLPNILAYLLSVMLVYAVSARLFNKQVAFVAAFLFAIAPVNILYALTAMSEATFVMAGLVAVYLFVLARGRWRNLLIPLVLIIPFLFRETGSLLVILLAALTLQNREHSNHLKLLVAIIISVILLAGIQWGLLAPDRPSLMAQNLFAQAPADKYSNAFATLNRPGELAGWFGLFEAKIEQNLNVLFAVLGGDDGGLQAIFLHLMLWPAIGAGIVAFYFQGLQRRFLQGYALCALVLFLLIITFYSVFGYVAVRQFLFLLPFECIALAIMLVNIMQRIDRRSKLSTLGAGIALIASLVALPLMARQVTANEHVMQADADFIRSLAPPFTSTLVMPYELVAGYFYQSFPVRWAFVPVNIKTLDLLHHKYPVGMMILPYQPGMTTWQYQQVAQRVGLTSIQLVRRQDTGKQVVVIR